MLSILWIIIKIILIILLSILGIVIASIFILLYVPFCYGAQFSWLEQKANGVLKVSWLFRMITVCLEIRDNQPAVKFLLFGRSLQRKKRSPNGKKDQSKKKEPVKSEKSVENALESDDNGQEVKQEEKESTSANTQELALEKEIIPETEEESEEKAGIFDKGKAFIHRLRENLIRVFRKIQSFWDELKAGKVKWDQWMELYHDERTQASIRLLKREGIRILKRVCPKKFHANLHVGLGDPAATGMLSGAVACLMPVYEDAVWLEPDFEKAVLEGDVMVKGKIRLGIFVVTAFRIWKDKNMRFLIKRFMVTVQP